VPLTCHSHWASVSKEKVSKMACGGGGVPIINYVWFLRPDGQPIALESDIRSISDEIKPSVSQGLIRKIWYGGGGHPIII